MADKPLGNANLASLVQLDDTDRALLTSIKQSQLGTGLPIPLAVADPGGSGYSAALDPNPITRACTRLRCWVANSGVIISLDGGVTASVSLPANAADDLAINIPAGADVRVKRLAAGTPITGLIVEVR